MSMSDRDGVIWYDGELVPWREANTHVLTHTLHYGMGVFEGVRAYNTPDGTAIFRLQAHTDRLFDSAHIFKKLQFVRCRWSGSPMASTPARSTRSCRSPSRV